MDLTLNRLLCHLVAARSLERSGVDIFAGPVRYRDEEEPPDFVQLQLADAMQDMSGLVANQFPGRVAGLYFTKAWDWSSEGEFRMLAHGDVDEYEYIDVSSALAAVFCGGRFPEARLGDLRERCPGLWDARRVFRIAWINGHPSAQALQDEMIRPSTRWNVPAVERNARPSNGP